MSSLQDSSPPASILRDEIDVHQTRTNDPGLAMPNKLVKRSTSQRVLSLDQARGSIFRRPATSHQRSSSLMPVSTPLMNSQQPIAETQERPYTSTADIWRPFFFNSGHSRKRHTSGTMRDSTIRTVSASYAPRPMLVNAKAVQRRQFDDDDDDQFPRPSPLPSSTIQRRQKLRPSLGAFGKSGRQRNFTDPTTRVFTEEAQGSILPATKQSPLSPVSRSSTFGVDFPNGTPVFTSSPPIRQIPGQTLRINKRTSVARSDPNTLSSDNDTRIFTDDDSMDFQSDTAYDSLATRATASSHSGYRQPKIETIFDEQQSSSTVNHVPALEALMQRSTLNERAANLPNNTPAWVENVGMGITGFDEDENMEALTPVRENGGPSLEELNNTPVAFRIHDHQLPNGSSPSSVVKRPAPAGYVPRIQYPEDMDIEKEDSIDWSPKSDKESKAIAEEAADSPTQLRFDIDAIQDSDSNKRSSIFDWSEQQRAGGDGTNGISPRPKTVHGKQGNEDIRSRASGRKGPNAVHLRSQSVPVSRESLVDVEVPPSAAKYGTWGLGNKPVSEEWNEDFDFDDGEDVDLIPQPLNDTIKHNARDSIRSVKVPQSIIDRQASVHLQFGQVQEFMTLVEELKRLRVQGVVLQLLNGQSEQLWEDADTIINLATINDEDDGPLRPPSPMSSDIFGDDNSPSSRKISMESSKRDSLTQRTVSNPATPQNGRPRGESLAQAKSFLQTIHQNRTGSDSSPAAAPATPQRGKLPFDTQDLRDLVVRAGAITRALKEIVRRAEGVSISPQRTPQRNHDASLSHIFYPLEASPSPADRKPGIPKSRSANSYLGAAGRNSDELPPPLRFTAVIEAN